MDPVIVVCSVVAFVFIAVTAVIRFWPRPAAPVVARAVAPRFIDEPRPAVAAALSARETAREKALTIVRLQRELGDEAEAREWERSAGDARLYAHRQAQAAAWGPAPVPAAPKV